MSGIEGWKLFIRIAPDAGTSQNYDMLIPDANTIAAESLRLEELGQFALALEGYRKALRADPSHLFAATRYFRLKRDLRPEPPHGIKLVWQIDPSHAWETEWVRYLLAGCASCEIADGRYSVFEDGCVVIDNHIGPERRAYYFELLKRGCRFALFHLSDEHYTDDGTVYGFANLVLRNYWSRAHSRDKNVIAVPLGMMSGFRASASKPTAERSHSWCFIGNLGKHSRIAMIQAMAGVEGGFLHGTDAVNARTPTEAERTGPHPPLGIGDYARHLSNTIFAPCPAGWENLDSFRVCEALEAGCIPIVEKRGPFGYFCHLFGEHPMLTVNHWNEAPPRIHELRADWAVLDARRRACADWWQDHKAALVTRVRDSVLERLSPRAVCL
jgi:hypothetical protein